MKIISALLAIALLTGCPSRDPAKKGKGATKPTPTRDDSGDIAFQSFVGRLRIAVEKRDAEMLASMMAQDFGYRWDNAPAGDTPFAYWEQNKLWDDLAALMRDKWIPYDGYMVVPSAMATGDYGGLRAGVRMTGGNWRFAYFVSAPPPEPPAPEPPAPVAL